ncbi:hypothetical protein IWX90DRAFT_484180 [Phyllosticta citrichinensis]|uniref:Uncharacterized protein n=1 Tax=Phyllosticta citrichinensis TaxID=1130410 RepID=A0ABR1XY16_9PEZI
MLTCIPHPQTPELNPPRGAVYPICNHYEDYNGRATLNIYLLTQVYVTFDAAPAEASDCEGLAIEIRRHILGVTLYEQRLDVRFLRPDEGITNIMDSHQAPVHAEHADPLKMEQEGLKGLYFNPIMSKPTRSSASVEPCYELDLVDDDAEDYARDIFTSQELNDDYAELFADARKLRFEIEEIAGELFSSWELKEEYIELFSNSKNAGMMEWQQVYITSKFTPMSALAREALAKELFNAIISDERRAYKRLDLHFMRPDQGVADFMESHRTILRAKAVVPSHACPKSLKVSSIIFAVSDTDWKQVGMKTLLFDLDPSKPVSETTWTSEEIIKTVGHVYNSCDMALGRLDRPRAFPAKGNTRANISGVAASSLNTTDETLGL